MLTSIKVRVGCTKFPNMKEGQIGFAESGHDRCLEPNYKYVNEGATGYIHIRNHKELQDLTERIGAMSVEQFRNYYRLKPSEAWINNYIHYLDKEIAKALIEKGIELTIKNTTIKFYTEPGYYEFTKIKPTKNFKENYEE